MAVFFSSMISCFPALLSRYCLENSEMVRCPCYSWYHVCSYIPHALNFYFELLLLLYYYYVIIIIHSNVLFSHGATAPSGPSLLMIEASRKLKQHTRYDSSGRVISPTHRPLPDNTQHSQQTGIHAPAGIEPAIPASEWPQTHGLDRAATGIGIRSNYRILILCLSLLAPTPLCVWGE